MVTLGINSDPVLIAALDWEAAEVQGHPHGTQERYGGKLET